MDIECEGTTPRWWARRTNLTLRTNERQHTLWGFYCFGGLLATNWNRGDGGLEEAFQRPVARYESPYRFKIRYNPQSRYVWGFYEGALFQRHEYTSDGWLVRSIVVYPTREEAARLPLWLQRADGTLERRVRQSE